MERFHHLVRVFTWAVEEFFPSASGRTISACSRVLEKAGRVWVTRGLPEALKYIKGVREAFLFALSAPKSSKTYQVRRRLRREFGWTMDVDDLNRVDPDFVRLLLTALTLLRSETLPPVLDVEAITSPSKNILRFDKWLPKREDFWKRLMVRVPKRSRPLPRWERFHFTTKRGPGGGHALLEAPENLLGLNQRLAQAIATVGGVNLINIMVNLRGRLEALTEVIGKVTDSPLRRLAAISDKEGKSRVVALLDYWSQTALRPVHDYLFGLLRTIPQDVTFDQGSFKDRVRDWESGEWYSVDLSKATDRFPISLIGFVLEGRFSPEWVDAWKVIMVGLPFESDLGPVEYRCGNPMGAYSS